MLINNFKKKEQLSNLLMQKNGFGFDVTVKDNIWFSFLA
jgi:hypothetical protein